MSGRTDTCCAELWTTGLSFDYNKGACGRPAKVTVDGKHYCGIHDPNKIKAKREAIQARWNVELEHNRKIRQFQLAAESMAKRHNLTTEKMNTDCYIVTEKVESRQSCSKKNAEIIGKTGQKK